MLELLRVQLQCGHILVGAIHVPACLERDLVLEFPRVQVWLLSTSSITGPPPEIARQWHPLHGSRWCAQRAVSRHALYRRSSSRRCLMPHTTRPCWPAVRRFVCQPRCPPARCLVCPRILIKSPMQLAKRRRTPWQLGPFQAPTAREGAGARKQGSDTAGCPPSFPFAGHWAITLLVAGSRRPPYLR
jgi:hypothetical protein